MTVKNLDTLNNNFDFNNLTKRGFYSAIIYQNNCPKNSPINDTVGMNIIVVECDFPTYISQLMMTTAAHFFRVYDIGTNNWTKWQKISLIEVD